LSGRLSGGDEPLRVADLAVSDLARSVSMIEVECTESSKSIALVHPSQV